MKATVFSVKPSKSGNHDIITLVTEEVKVTPFGKNTITTYYNMLLEKGSASVGEGEEVDLDLAQYEVETSTLASGVSRWLRMK